MGGRDGARERANAERDGDRQLQQQFSANQPTVFHFISDFHFSFIFQQLSLKFCVHFVWRRMKFFNLNIS